MTKVAVVGSLNADLTVRTERLPRPGETVHGSPLVVAAGGKSANQAAAASKLGAEVSSAGSGRARSERSLGPTRAGGGQGRY